MILVTGASGYLGRHVVALLAEGEIPHRGTSRSGNGHIPCDLTDPGDVAAKATARTAATLADAPTPVALISVAEYTYPLHRSSIGPIPESGSHPLRPMEKLQ